MTKRDKDEIAVGLRTEKESRAEFEKRVNDLNQQVETLRAARPVTPVDLTDREGPFVTRKGGLFAKGETPMQPIELLGLSPSNPSLRGSDAELLRDFQDSWDAAVFKRTMETCVMGTSPYAFEGACEKAAKAPDFKRVQRCLKWMGHDPDKSVNVKGYTRPDEYAREVLKIIHPESGGAVNPLTFTVLSAQVVDLVRLALRVASNVTQVPLAHTNQKIPTNRGDCIGVRGGAATTDPPPTVDPTTFMPHAEMLGTIAFGTADFDVETVLTFLTWQDRAVMESAIALLPYLRNQVVFGFSRAIDRSCMSGDIQGRTAGAHMDDHTDLMSVRDARTLWNGFRRIGANYMTSNGGGSFDGADFRASRRRLGVFGMVADDLICWMNTGPLYDLMATTEVLTIEKFGPQAVVKTGQLAAIDGTALVPSEWIPTDLDATTGFSTAAGTTTAVVLANWTRFLLGQLGIVGIETFRIPPMLTTIIQAVGYYDFVPVEAVDANGIFAASQTVPLDITRNTAR